MESSNFDTDPRCTNSNEDLLQAAKEGNLTVVELILQRCNNTDINTEDSSTSDFTPLIWSSYYGHSEVVLLLLQHPQIDVNKVDNYGKTALYWASKNGHLDVVELLLQHPQIRSGDYFLTSGGQSLDDVCARLYGPCQPSCIRRHCMCANFSPQNYPPWWDYHYCSNY